MLLQAESPIALAAEKQDQRCRLHIQIRYQKTVKPPLAHPIRMPPSTPTISSAAKAVGGGHAVRSMQQNDAASDMTEPTEISVPAEQESCNEWQCRGLKYQ